MSKIKPTAPSFLFGYWRPWKENSNLIDSYLDYARDKSLAKYGADTVGNYINQASKEQVNAINQLGQAIGRGINVLSHQMSDINEALFFLNRNMEVQLEQQKLSNLLLQNISELLRVPDSEKERQHCIELGIKFFVNGSKDSDLYSDSLDELLKAESLMKQDYFVLHRIGIIYLHIEKFINPEKALDYFLRAGKYASVESDNDAARLASVLTNDFNTVNSEVYSSERQIGLLAAESYEKAAFCAYILGRFDEAVNFQTKALKFNEISQNRFYLAKYQIRNNQIDEGVKNINKCIEEEPLYSIAVFKEIDLINEPSITELISRKNNEINSKIENLIEKWKVYDSKDSEDFVNQLINLLGESYDIKVPQFKLLFDKSENLSSDLSHLKLKVRELIKHIKKTAFVNLSPDNIQDIIVELETSISLPKDKIETIYKRNYNKIEKDTLKIGSKIYGGIVFYIDKSKKHGLICTDIDLGDVIWGEQGNIGANGNGIADESGRQNTIKIVENSSTHLQKGIFSTKKTPIITAARLCLESNHNGYNDWYLPTIKELELIYKNLAKLNKRKFKEGYWSSTEYGDIESLSSGGKTKKLGDGAWFFDFGKGKKYYDFKDSQWKMFLFDIKQGEANIKSVRAVRIF